MAEPPVDLMKTSYQHCFSTLGCPESSLERIAALALEFGVPCLELRALDGRIDLPRQLAEFPGGWNGAREFLRDRNLDVRVLGTSFKLIGNDTGAWTELLAFAELAEALGCPYLRVFSGGTWGNELHVSDYRQAAEAVACWQMERRTRGWSVDLLLETHDAFSASVPCLRLLDQVAEPLGFIWDSHHTWRLGGESPAQSWEALSSHVKHVHLKDSIGQPSARHPFTYVLPGTGEMPSGEVLELLRRDGYSGAVSLEWEKMWHPYLGSLAEALESCRQNHWW